jgi:rubrerythrin
LENSQKQLLDLQTKRTEGVEKTLSETKQSYDKVIERQQVASQDLTTRLLEAQASHTSASVALQNKVNTLQEDLRASAAASKSLESKVDTLQEDLKTSEALRSKATKLERDLKDVARRDVRSRRTWICWSCKRKFTATLADMVKTTRCPHCWMRNYTTGY